MKNNTLYGFIIILLLLTIGSVYYYNSTKQNCCIYQLICSNEGYIISFDNEPVGYIPLGNTALDSLMTDLNE